ncbi:penicillin-binding protein 1A [Aquariibacter albus]|uniref:Penicillin-binding protein 1A n=1 Tax=Aquariibacter albus TaxID=2759899 RepID=A0A839HIZ0_9BURK|nr:penicillin-binding protein 1A [Aquariibacter albus]
MPAPDPTPKPRARPARPPRPLWLRALGMLALLGVGGLLAGLALLALALAMAYPNLPDLDGIDNYRPKLPMRVYSAEGRLIGEFGEERRLFMPIAQIPARMKDAVLAIEDARFYQHSGIDYLGIVRAGLANVTDARSQGASTITMQVARNFYLSTEKTLTRKIYEILLSLKIEKQLSKDEILELYMNQIYLGHRAYGFAAAAETYFGKPLDKLSIAEAAMLAGLPKAPSAYNPFTNPTRSRTRQLHIIDRMYENGFITEEEAEAAKVAPLKYRERKQVPLHAEYVAEQARQLMFQQYGEDAYTRGLRVDTSLRLEEQEVAYRALRRGILDYERRQHYRGPEAELVLPPDGDPALDEKIAEALETYPDNDEVQAAVVLAASPNEVSVILRDGQRLRLSGDSLKPVASGLSPKANPKVQIRRGSVVRVVPAEGQITGPVSRWFLTQLPEVEGAFVALDVNTGAIRALVGGFDFAKNKFNHVTQAWRQPGSSFKPFVYSAALEKGITPSTVVDDAPLFYSAEATGSQPWEPKNYDGKFEGPMPLRTALAKSKNMVSIRVLESIGTDYAQQWITRFGFEAARHPAYLPMALGTGSVTPLQMASAYGVFGNSGYLVAPRLVTRVSDDQGRLLLDLTPQPPTEEQRVIAPRNAFLMSSLLQEVTRSGTAARAQATLKRPDLYGKTGTTNDSVDAWFAGYGPGVVAVCWIGYDQPKKLGSRETGGGLALPVWIDYMNRALRGVPVFEVPVPEGVSQIGGEWYFEEYTPGHGVDHLGKALPEAAPASPDEKKGILDLFR